MDTEHRNPDSGHRTADGEHRTADTGHRTAGSEHRTADTGHRTAGSEHRTADAGVSRPARPRPGPALVVAAFALWTLFVWGGRLRNLWLEPGGFGEAGRWSLYGSLAFTVLGLVVLAAWIGRRFGPAGGAAGSGLLRGSVLVLGPLTTGVWLVRAVDISLGDHSAGFIAVHVVLAVVSIGLAAASVRGVLADGSGDRRRGRDGTPPPRPSEPGRSPVG